MKKALILTVFCLLSVKSICVDVKIHISFNKNNQTIILKDNFAIYLFFEDENKKTLIKPTIRNNSFDMPKTIVHDSKSGYIVFLYRRKYYAFKIDNFFFSQNMKWEIKFTTRSTLSKNYKENVKRIRAESLIVIHPLEYGEGFVSTMLISNFRRYFLTSAELIKDI
jgi:hypothetical protein